MRWKFKFKPDWDYFFDCCKNIGVILFATGLISELLNKPDGISVLICGFVIIILAWCGRSFKIEK